VLGLFDTTLLWSSLGVSLLVLVAGAFLVPALSLRDALLAILVGSLIGNGMLGAAGLIGADARVPAMVLLRAPLGRRGSYLPTVLNVLQCLGWAVFELIIIATASAALSKELFGFEARWLWTLVFGLVTLALVLLGPIGVVRRYLKTFAFWAVVASLAYLTWWTLDGADLGALWARRGEGGLPFFGGVDLVVAITVSWVPLIADYTRFSRSRAPAFWGTGVGYFVSATWLFALGALLFLSRDLGDAAAVPAAVAAGGVGAVLALLAVTIDEADEAFANVYSAAVSTQNVLARVPQRALLVAATVVATAGALLLEIRDYEAFLYLLGSCFVPLFGVMLADWLVRGVRFSETDIFRAPPVRPVPVAAWLVGFALYQWLHPVGPSWWTDLVARVHPAELSTGATLPSFGAAFGLTALAGIALRRAGPGLARA
jgi:putative hydroxymethylpyrimidine transporter CytX